MHYFDILANISFGEYSGSSNSCHFWGPSLVVVVLEGTAMGRFYMHVFFYQKSWSEEIGGGLKQFFPLRMSHHINTRNIDYCLHLTYIQQNQVTKLY